MEYTPALFNLAVSLAVAIFTAIFSVWLSARRFRSERLWETKMKAYSDLLLALHTIRHDTEISVAAERNNTDTDTDFYRQWSARHVAAWEEIRKQIDVDELFLSGRTIQCLRDLRARANAHDGSTMGHLLAMQDAIAKYLPFLKDEARRDLQITVHPLWPNYYR